MRSRLVTLKTSIRIINISINRNLSRKKTRWSPFTPPPNPECKIYLLVVAVSTQLSLSFKKKILPLTIHQACIISKRILIQFFSFFNYLMEFAITQDWCAVHSLNWNLMHTLSDIFSLTRYSKCIQYSFILNISIIYFDMPFLSESNNFSLKNL